MRRSVVLLTTISLFFSFSSSALSQEETQKAPELVGEFFGMPVPLENYYFVKSAIMVFGNKWGPQPKTKEQWDEDIWDQLLLSYEAFRRGVTVDQQEVEEEVKKILAAEKADFDPQSDKEAYEQWAKEKINEPAELFENQIRHLLQIDKLRGQVMESIEPEVNEKEAYEEFLNEYNNLSVELRECEDKQEADSFYKKVKKNPKAWDEDKEANPKKFRQPGGVSLEFLMDLWKFPKEAVYKMIKMKPGSIYPPTPIYKGYGVFKILGVRRADPKEFEKVRNSYFAQVKRRKQFEGLGRWFEDLREEAKITIYEKQNQQGGADE